MFTGIVEELGYVKSITKGRNSSRIEIKASTVLSDVKIGDSIAVNGICLTVTDFSSTSFCADIMHETLRRSSISKVAVNDRLNLERAMPLNGRFGGHIVSGHIDGVGKIKNIKRDDIAIWFDISCSSDILKYIIEKGSIAIDGISLTIADLKSDSFMVSCIPHTIEQTVLKYKNIGDMVNIENDLIAKYVEKFVSVNKSKNIINEDFLKLHGY
jgi:riboflavin synthase